VRGALQLRTALRSGEKVDPLEAVAEPASPPPQPVSKTPVTNAAIHAFDTLMTRFIDTSHQVFVEFVKLYKTRRIIDVKLVSFPVTKSSISRQETVMQ
jgi:hypothetical protein